MTLLDTERRLPENLWLRNVPLIFALSSHPSVKFYQIIKEIPFQALTIERFMLF
ncbi:hypothetical protein M595_2481 [Lyngbya aestuarii BL J]|uniref:Uncharacterized protein n=1 Tax=Lyngbya aestuarii BL J TaxID=1348334 RepID=U7QHY3_9CYAN|nr:hypothetical protein M595_2481 [Lyngbya aestuarii BL J]